MLRMSYSDHFSVCRPSVYPFVHPSVNTFKRQLLDQWPFCLVAMATLNLKRRNFLNDNSSNTTEAVGLLFGINVAWLRTIQNNENFGNLPIDLVAMSTESCHRLINNGKMVKLHFLLNQ